MKNFACPTKSDLAQKGIIAPIIIIIVAAFGLGLAGPVIYPKVKVQVEKLISKPIATPVPEETQEPESQKVTESAADKSQQPSIDVNVETNITEQGQTEELEESEPGQEAGIEEPEPKEKGQKDKNEEGKVEGVEDEPPVDIPFKVLDFKNLFSSLFSPKPTSIPATGLIGKIKIPSFLTGSTPTPTPTPTPGPKKAIVVILDKVKVHNDEDPGPLNGEVQIVTATRTGFTEQVTAWPMKNWDEANSDDTLKIDRPIFVLPKDLVDEKLALWITVVENDSLPSSAPGLIKKAFQISEGTHLLLENPTAFLATYALDKATDKFLNWLGSEEHIGTYATVLYKSQNFGMGGENKKTFTVKKKNATITYTVRELTIPEKPLRVDIKVKKIRVGEAGDDDAIRGAGDLYVWTYVSDGFDGKEPHGLLKRIPKKGLHDKEDNSTWDIDTEIFSAKVTSPVLYYEIGVWDDDDGDNDDQLEIVTDTLYINAHKPGEVIKAEKDGDDGVDADATIEREVRFFAAD